MADPNACGESILAWGVPVCRIECIPCASVKECPLEKEMDMSMLVGEQDG